STSRTSLFPYTTLFRSNRLRNARQRNAHLQRGFRRPAACALLPGAVEDLIDQRAAVRVLEGKDLRCNLDQVRVEHTLVPARARRSEEHTSELQSRENLV